MNRAILAILAISVASCGAKTPCPVPAPEPVPADGGPCRYSELAITDTCYAAEQVLCYLGCTWDDRTPVWRTASGRWFGDICSQARADGRNWRSDCIYLMRSCDQLEAAFRVPEGTPCPAP